MNDGLLAWPEGRLPGPPGLLGFPSRRRQHVERPELVESDLIGTSSTLTETDMVVTLPPNLEVGDLCIVALKCSANNTPGTPTGWSVLQSGAQGSQGNITLIKLIDGTEGGTVTITSAGAAAYSAIAARVARPGFDRGSGLPYAAGSPNSASGATPTLSSVSLFDGRSGDVPCLALGIGTGLFAASLGNYPTSGIFKTSIGQGASSPTTWFTPYGGGIAINNDNTRTAWIVWADILGGSIPQYLGVGTWTNFTHVHVLVPPRRRQGVQYR